MKAKEYEARLDADRRYSVWHEVLWQAAQDAEVSPEEFEGLCDRAYGRKKHEA